jgi:flagellar biosynthesis/type III secretory pathway protein FliH
MRRYEAIAKTEGRAEGREEGRAEGMSQLANAIQELKAGASKDELLKKYDEQTVNLAIACR